MPRVCNEQSDHAKQHLFDVEHIGAPEWFDKMFEHVRRFDQYIYQRSTASSDEITNRGRGPLIISSWLYHITPLASNVF
jgi:hypothetical protein